MISTCPACSQTVNIGEDLIGRDVRCPSCHTVFRVGRSVHEVSAVDGEEVGYGGPRQSGDNPLLGPGIGLLVAGGCAFLYQVFNLVATIASLGREIEIPFVGTQKVDAVSVVVAGIAVLWSALVGIGAVAMIARRGYGLAWTGAVLGVVPCYVCCFLGIPFGIWGMVVLSREDVRQSFQV